jgi:hypothetical protein
MIVSIEGLGLNITPEFMASQSSETQQNNAGNEALASDIVDRINAAGYHARSVPSCSETTWLTAACNFNIRVDEFPELVFSVGGNDWQTKTAENRAAFVISTGKVQTQGMYVPSTGSTSDSSSRATSTRPDVHPRIQQSSVTPAASITNLSRPSASSFQVGDRWEIRVSGAANSPVSVTAKLPNGETSSTSYGSTDSSGSYRMNGQMAEDSIGHWVETWHVGNRDAAAISFDVLPAASKETPSGTSQDILKDILPTGDVSSWVSENKWLLIGGAAALFFVMGRGK